MVTQGPHQDASWEEGGAWGALGSCQLRGCTVADRVHSSTETDLPDDSGLWRVLSPSKNQHLNSRFPGSDGSPAIILVPGSSAQL